MKKKDYKDINGQWAMQKKDEKKVKKRENKKWE
jgi:hypothetical protein